MKNETYIIHLNEKYKEKSGELFIHIKTIEDFYIFLDENGIENEQDITQKVAISYIVQKREQYENINEIIGILTDYAFFIQNEILATEMVLLNDAWNVMNRMSELTKKHDLEVWRQVYEGVVMPKIGSTLDEMSNFSREIEKKMLAVVPREQYEHIMCKNAHSWEPEWDGDWRKRFLEMKSVDRFIDSLNNEIIKSVEESCTKNELCFTQRVDDEAVEYARSNPIYTRIGNKIHSKKIPFMINNYLRATDVKMKRYYYCHCAWTKNSILQATGAVSHSFCHCSLGFDKKPFDVAFGQAISGRVIYTVKDENCLACTFEFEIPEKIMEQFT